MGKWKVVGMAVGFGLFCTAFLSSLALAGLGGPGGNKTVWPTAVPTTSATSPPSGATTSGGAGDLTIVAKNITFDKTSLQAPAGPVKITFMNQDTGTVHDFHLFQGSNASGHSVGQTPLIAGPTTQTLTATLAAGTYYFQCDVHPDQMKGTLTVR